MVKPFEQVANGVIVTTYDVVVVGAGPAGSSAAFHCASAGLSTLVLEKHILPRYKPCGGMVSERCVNDLGLEGHIIDRAQKCQLVLEHEMISEREADVCLVDRSDFDMAMTERAEGAGAEICTGSMVTSISSDSESATAVLSDGRTLTAKVIIGADGVNSKVRSSTCLERYQGTTGPTCKHSA